MKTRQVGFSPEALHDLQEIFNRISLAAGRRTALAYAGRLEKFLLGLGSASERGHLRDDIRPGLRVLGFERRLTIAFTVIEDRVIILRIHGAGRDWEKLMGE